MNHFAIASNCVILFILFNKPISHDCYTFIFSMLTCYIILYSKVG
jgi:hypothetical protein